jgi:hypothetical protein
VGTVGTGSRYQSKFDTVRYSLHIPIKIKYLPCGKKETNNLARLHPHITASRFCRRIPLPVWYIEMDAVLLARLHPHTTVSRFCGRISFTSVVHRDGRHSVSQASPTHNRFSLLWANFFTCVVHRDVRHSVGLLAFVVAFLYLCGT